MTPEAVLIEAYIVLGISLLPVCLGLYLVWELVHVQRRFLRDVQDLYRTATGEPKRPKLHVVPGPSKERE